MKDLDFLAQLDGVGQAELVCAGELSAVELIDACAARLEAVNPLLRVVTTVDLDRARTRAAGSLAGPFAGVPFLVKDLLAYPGMRWSMGSRLFKGNRAESGSPYTERLDEAGLVTVGKSTTSELGLLGSTETLLEGVTHNPWDLTRSAAGSSGGAAAAVAAGVVPLAHASDGGGSIRVPASVCGLFGFKPSRGRCVPAGPEGSDMFGLLSEHCVSRSVRDSALLLSVTEDRSPGAAFPRLGYVREATRGRLRIGAFTTSLMGTEPEPEVRRAFEQACSLCRELGHDVEVTAAPDLSGPAIRDGFFLLAGAALAGVTQMMSGALGRPVGRGDIEPFTRALIDHFRAQPAGALEQTHASLARASQGYLDATAGFDVVLTPTLATLPWRLGELSPLGSRDQLLERTARSVCYTPIHNMAGCPAMSVPLGWSDDGLPIGIHFAARPGDEARLFSLAYQLEEARPWRERWAPWSFPVLSRA